MVSFNTIIGGDGTKVETLRAQGMGGKYTQADARLKWRAWR